jgi:ABC-type Zn uptake system ZnuABC Zn-binding protein ZnuA
MKNRTTFSKYIYKLHEIINEMLGKESGLSFINVRDRYEYFRSRCSNNQTKPNKTEKGCADPIYGEKSKCILKIVPETKKCDTFIVDKTCRNPKL